MHETVRQAIIDYNLPVKVIGRAAGFAANSPDLVIDYQNNVLNFEIKRHNAQMGEASYSFDRTTFNVISVIDKELSDLVLNDILSHKKDDINRLIDFLREQEPKAYHEKIDRFPCMVTRAAWTKAVAANLTAPISSRAQFHIGAVKSFYQMKKIEYMQIERRGIYHLGIDRLCKSIPELECEMKVLVRMKRSGSRPSVELGENTASVRIISTGRLLLGSLKNSLYNLDDLSSVQGLFA